MLIKEIPQNSYHLHQKKSMAVLKEKYYLSSALRDLLLVVVEFFCCFFFLINFTFFLSPQVQSANRLHHSKQQWYLQRGGRGELGRVGNQSCKKVKLHGTSDCEPSTVKKEVTIVIIM